MWIPAYRRQGETKHKNTILNIIKYDPQTYFVWQAELLFLLFSLNLDPNASSTCHLDY